MRTANPRMPVRWHASLTDDGNARTFLAGRAARQAWLSSAIEARASTMPSNASCAAAIAVLRKVVEHLGGAPPTSQRERGTGGVSVSAGCAARPQLAAQSDQLEHDRHGARASAFHVGISDAVWLVASLYVTSAVTQPTMGGARRSQGARRVFL